jgi:outer membrane immunogenic protein
LPTVAQEAQLSEPFPRYKCSHATLIGWRGVMKNLLFASATLATLVGTPVLAADMALKAPPPAPPPCIWCGWYIGANAGGIWSDPNVTTSASNLSNNGSPGAIEAVPVETALANTSLRTRSDGFIGGGQIGYNYQFGSSFVAGIEADIQGIGGHSSSSTLTSSGTTVINGPLMQTATASTKVDYLGTVRGRVGVLGTPNLLLYGTGGLAYGRVEASATNSQVFFADPDASGSLPHTGTGSISQTRAGWTAGVGAEWKFTRNWSLKAEYLYYNLGTASFSYASNHLLTGSGALFIATGLTSSARFDGSIARAGVNYAF